MEWNKEYGFLQPQDAEPIDWRIKVLFFALVISLLVAIGFWIKG